LTSQISIEKFSEDIETIFISMNLTWESDRESYLGYFQADINPKIKEKFIREYLPQKFYHRHSDIDVFVNITITQLLNYNTLLNEECNKYIQSNFIDNYNFNYYDEIVEQKKQELQKIKKEGLNSIKYPDGKNSILSFEFPEFEIYFIAKLY